jgi:hypothetical protein
MLERLMCSVFGHRYVEERRLSRQARKVACTRCRMAWAMYDPLRLMVEWDAEFESFYGPDGLLRETKE